MIIGEMGDETEPELERYNLWPLRGLGSRNVENLLKSGTH